MGNDSQAKQQAAPSGDMTSKLIGMAMAEAMKVRRDQTVALYCYGHY